MRYERPRIVHRERIEALLSPAVKSDVSTPSDVRVKEHIRPVTWGDGPTAYTPPAITGREPLAGLLDTVVSDGTPGPDGAAP